MDRPPTELRAVLYVFRHLRLQHLEPCRSSVARRHQFQYEVGTHGSQLLLLFIGQSLPTLVLQPRRIRRAPRAIGKREQRKRTKRDSRSILLSPVSEPSANDRAAAARFPSRQSHDHQLFLGGEFEMKVAIVATKLDKLFVR